MRLMRLQSLWSHCQYQPHLVRIVCYQPQLIIGQRALSVRIRISDQLQYVLGLVIVHEIDAESRVNMPKTGQTTVLAGCYDPAAGGYLLFLDAQQFAIVKLVVPAVFQRTVGVDTGFMGKGIGSNAGLVYRYGHTEAVGYVIGKLVSHRKVYRVADFVAFHVTPELYRQYAAQEVGLPCPLAQPIHRGVDISIHAAIHRALGAHY